MSDTDVATQASTEAEQQAALVRAERARIFGEMALELERDYPERWEPSEHGNDIFGVIVAIQETIETAHGPVAVVELEGKTGGRRSVWLTHAVLRNAFVRARPEVGDFVGIHYGGKIERHDAPDFESYKLVIRRVNSLEPNADWDTVRRQAIKPTPS